MLSETRYGGHNRTSCRCHQIQQIQITPLSLLVCGLTHTPYKVQNYNLKEGISIFIYHTFRDLDI